MGSCFTIWDQDRILWASLKALTVLSSLRLFSCCCDLSLWTLWQQELEATNYIAPTFKKQRVTTAQLQLSRSAAQRTVPTTEWIGLTITVTIIESPSLGTAPVSQVTPVLPELRAEMNHPTSQSRTDPSFLFKPLFRPCFGFPFELIMDFHSLCKLSCLKLSHALCVCVYVFICLLIYFRNSDLKTEIVSCLHSSQHYTYAHGT